MASPCVHPLDAARSRCLPTHSQAARKGPALGSPVPPRSSMPHGAAAPRPVTAHKLKQSLPNRGVDVTQIIIHTEPFTPKPGAAERETGVRGNSQSAPCVCTNVPERSPLGLTAHSTNMCKFFFFLIQTRKVPPTASAAPVSGSGPCTLECMVTLAIQAPGLSCGPGFRPGSGMRRPGLLHCRCTRRPATHARVPVKSLGQRPVHRPENGPGQRDS